MIYWVAFLISLLFIFISEKSVASTRSIYKRIFICLSFLPPVWLAGMRDFAIGTDIKVYGIPEFYFAKGFDQFTTRLFMKTESSIEWGYRLLNFLVSRFTDDVGWLLGIVCLLIIIFIYFALVEYKDCCNPKISITFGMFVFYVLFYNESYNLLRQSIAIVLVMFATRFIWKRQWKLFAMTVFIATFFHVTAILGLILYPLYSYIVVKGQRKFGYILCLATVLFFFILPYVINQIIGFGVLPAKFTRYLINENIEGISVNQFIIRSPFIILTFALIRHMKDNILKNRFAFFGVLLVLDLFFSELRSTSPTLYRLSLYFSYPKIFIYPEIVGKISVKMTGNVKIDWLKIGVIIFFVVLWIYQVVIQGNGQTYPYVFR